MRLRLIVALLLTVGVVGVVAQDASPQAKLSELQQAKAQILALKVEVAQLRATLADRESRIASVELSKEQAALADEFLKAVGAPAGSTWDWAEMKPKEPAKPPKDKE